MYSIEILDSGHKEKSVGDKEPILTKNFACLAEAATDDCGQPHRFAQVLIAWPLTFLCQMLLVTSIMAQNETAKEEVSPVKTEDQDIQVDSQSTAVKGLATATFGNGCFWCTEAVFQRVRGVSKVVSGYMGGHVPNPTYEIVSTKKSGHAEVLQLQYDPQLVNYDQLLEIFWKTHDPTTPNRQGNDVGPQYRSVIFYHNQQQKELAESYKRKLDQAKAFRNPIVTEIQEATEFYPAEDYHQNYYNLNKRQNPYCQMIQYKLEKFRTVFPDAIDPEKDRIK